MVRSRLVAWYVVSAALACGSAHGFAQTPERLVAPLSLDAAVEALVARNLSVAAARDTVDIFRAQRVAAALKPDPTIVVSATQLTLPRVVTHPQYAGVAVPEGSVLDTQFSVDVAKVVERGGKRELRVAAADIESGIAEAQLSNELRQQTFELKRVFVSALLARENIRVLRANLGDFARMQHVFGEQVDEGYTAGVDLRRIGLELIELHGSMSAAQTDYAQGVRDIFNLIGDGDKASPSSAAPFLRTVAADVPLSELTEPIDDDGLDLLAGDLIVEPVKLSIDDLRTIALANRPDLRAAKLELDAADAAVRLADASRTRDVTVGAQYLRSGPDNAVGVALGVPLTTGRRAAASIAQANAARSQAQARWRQIRAQVLTDVEKAIVAYRVSRDRLRIFDDSILQQAREVRTIEEMAYQEGERGLLSLLDAQHAHNQTLISYNEARHAFALSVYQLESATGTSATRLAGARPSASGGSHE
jgi:outer membrane protein, heavy metal efflux system